MGDNAMATTAYSQHYSRELDVDQLAWLLVGLAPVVGQSAPEIDPKWNTWILSDVRCSSCGRSGAHVVRSARSRQSRKIIRQSHFRFVSQDGSDAHHPLCEFCGADENLIKQPEGLVDLSSERSAETRLIRELVCKGIERGLFGQTHIRAMRQWFFDLKASSRFAVETTPNELEWAKRLRRHPHYHRWTFHPSQAEMPGFDWGAAARYAFTEENLHLFDLVGPMHGETSDWRRAEELARRYHGEEVLDVAILRPYYEKAVTLCLFVGKNSGLKFSSMDPDQYRWKGPPVPLLALCALTLFVSDWDMNRAIGVFSAILSAPASADLSLGNVIGLNPFHEYTPWSLVAKAREVARQSVGDLHYPGRLATIEARLHEEHRQWKSEQRP